MTANDAAWALIFKELDIPGALSRSPFFRITANDIKRIGKREPRLMAKFDTKESLPAIFREYELALNADTNGSYQVFKDPGFRSFISLPDYRLMEPVRFSPVLPFSLDTLPFSSRLTESNALDFAHHSGLLSIVCNEPDLRLTTRGRFFSDTFPVVLPDGPSFTVNRVQVEVDAGYEGLNSLILLEAKSGTRSNFNIRQLYYPYKHFAAKTLKPVHTMLMQFSNGVFYFTEITFGRHYFDHSILRSLAYEPVFKTEPMPKLSLTDLLALPVHIPVGIPVPQADDLNKVVDVLLFLFENPSDKSQIAARFEFDDRQGDYYANAARYLGLADKAGNLFSLTGSGLALVSEESRNPRNLLLVRALFGTPLFNDLCRLYFIQLRRLPDSQIDARLASDGLTGTTPARRRGTIKAWLAWTEKALVASGILPAPYQLFHVEQDNA